MLYGIWTVGVKKIYIAEVEKGHCPFQFKPVVLIIDLIATLNYLKKNRKKFTYTIGKLGNILSPNFFPQCQTWKISL